MVKKYLNINEVSKLLEIKEHIIRYWDSVDPKTNKLRFEGISTKTRKGTRYFNNENISKLKKLKNLLYENGSKNHTLELANKLLYLNKNRENGRIVNETERNTIDHEKLKKIREILQNLKTLCK